MLFFVQSTVSKWFDLCVGISCINTSCIIVVFTSNAPPVGAIPMTYCQKRVHDVPTANCGSVMYPLFGLHSANVIVNRTKIKKAIYLRDTFDDTATFITSKRTSQCSTKTLNTEQCHKVSHRAPKPDETEHPSCRKCCHLSDA